MDKKVSTGLNINALFVQDNHQKGWIGVDGTFTSRWLD